MQWPQQVMSMNGYPHGCELDAIVAASVTECDPLDGVTDGIISDIEACLDRFDPFSLVGSSMECDEAGAEGEVEISKAAATVVRNTWDGIRSADGTFSWFGYTPGTVLTGNESGIAETDCSSGTCVGAPNGLGTQWLQFFVAKDPEFDLSNLTHKEFDTLVHQGSIYNSLLSTSDPDLSRFRDAGGKMVTYHGLVCVFPARTPCIVRRPRTNDAYMYRLITSCRPTARRNTTTPSQICSPTPPTSTATSRSPAWTTARAAKADSQRACSRN